MELPTRSVPPEYTTVTLIQYPRSESHATGFFYSDESENTYLVTNKHVINPEGESLSEIRILLRGQKGMRDLEFRDIDLYDDSNNPIWLVHPSDPTVDIAVIPLDVNIRSHSNLTVSEGMFLPNDRDITAGEQAMVIGHPIKGIRPYMPVARSALISSPYGMPFEGDQCFATDANMHSGTSGSPVFTIPSSIQERGGWPSLVGSQQSHFLGVHSASLYSVHDDVEGPLNLNLTWYAELIEEII